MKPPLHVVILGLFCAVTAGSNLVHSETASGDDPPTITHIRLEGTNVQITARVPVGLKRLVLQGSQSLGLAAWQPRAVVRLDGKGGTVTFNVGRSPELEMVRVRADADDPLPSLFYRGTNVFQGTLLSSSASNPGTLVFAAAPGGTVNDSAAATPPGKEISPTRTVVESDIWKIDGNVLYFFNQYRGLQVIDITNPDSPSVRASLSLPAVGEQMYVLSNGKVVLLAGNNCSGTADSGSEVLVVDASTSVPNVVATLPLSGQIQESRMVGTALYVMTQTYRAVAGSKDGSWEWGTTVYGFDLSDPAGPVARPQSWYSGYGNVLSATDRYLFVSVVADSGNSQVHCIDISAPDGTMQKAASINVAGNVTDKYKLNLSGDIFTAISVNWSGSVKGQAGPVTILENYSIANPLAPAKLGQLRLASGEQLHATRFDGNRVYVVTYYQVDPLWVVDLSDPANPAIKGAVKVPGWSTYIQPLGDRLLTIGIDNTNGWRVAVSLFDVHDAAAPTLLSKVPLGVDSSWSEATVDDKAFGFLPEAGLILVPYSSYSATIQEGVQLIDFASDALVKRGFIPQNMQARRSTLVHDRILSISARELLTVDATDRDHPLVRTNTTLAWGIDQVFVQGDYLVELESSSASPNAPAIRVVSKVAPEIILSSITLTNLGVLGATVRDQHLYLLQGTSTYGGPIIYFADGTGQASGTNQTSLVCSALDLSNLPNLGVINSTSMNTSNTLSGAADAIWPKPDLLVWAMQQPYYWAWLKFAPLGGVGLPPSIVFANDVSSGISVMPILPGPYLYPYGAYGDSQLYGVDVSNPLSPQFVSEVNLSTTNGWASFSKPFTADNSVYLSQESTETTITSTNLVVVTNITYVVMTNTVVVTNYVKIPHENIETNYFTDTNIVVVAVRNKLGDQAAMDPSTNAGPPVAPQIIGGGAFHSMALSSDGQVWTWGGNTDGQLGQTSPSDQPPPAPLTSLSSLLSIASGSLHSLALKQDGTVWAWGNDVFGQLGNGAGPADPNMPPLPDLGGPTPVQIGLKGVIAVAAGGFHSLALEADGSVWTWGGNWAGQLGDGTLDNHNIPIPVAKLSDIAQVAGGHSHSLALKKDGTIWAWGGNDAGQLGIGSRSDQQFPILIDGLTDVTALASGHSHCLALKSDGTVWAWGRNDSGQLGDGTTQEHTVPALVPELNDVVAIACGQSHSLALKRDGTVWAWGRNKDSQVSAGGQGDASKPLMVGLLPKCRAVAGGESHSLAVSAQGDIYAWGRNDHGQLGKGDILTQTNVYSGTNYLTTTTWTVDTQTVLQTNRVKIAQNVIQTNEVPIYTTRQVSSLRVVDYTLSGAPVPRPPVSIPGSLVGLAHQGALLYLVGANVNSSSNDGSEWLHACSYDGVSCYLVDSHALPKDWPHPVLVAEPDIYIARPQVDKGSAAALEVWTVSDAAKFSKLNERILGATSSSLVNIGDLLVSQEDSGIELFDLGAPIDLPLIGQGSPPGCIGWNLNQAAGSKADGLWLPLGLYGIDGLEIKK